MCSKTEFGDNDSSPCINNIMDTLNTTTLDTAALDIPRGVIELAIKDNCTAKELCLVKPQYGKYKDKEEEEDDKKRIEKEATRNSWLFGLVNAVAFIAAGFV